MSQAQVGLLIALLVVLGLGVPLLRRSVARQLRAFRESYREAFTAWREGARDAPFPHGTWEMVQVHGARGTPCGSSVAV